MVLFVEQLRHLLTKHGGHVALNQLETAYTAEFGVPSNHEVQKYLQKRLPHVSFHVVNLASHKWAVWSPTGYPYPPQRWLGGISTSGPPSTASSWPSFDEEPSTSSTVISGHVDASTSFVDDLVDLSETPPPGAGDMKLDSEKGPFGDMFASTSNSMSSAPELLGSLSDGSRQKTSDLIDFSDVLDLSAVTAEENTTLDEGNLDDLSFASASKLPPSAPTTSTADSAPSHSDPVPEAPYDFLKQHPDLIAELSKTSCPLPMDDLSVLAEVLTLQRLREMGIEVPSGMGGPSSQVLPSLAAEEVSVPPPGGANQRVDYLQLDWSPSQVLAELQRQKEECGGVLPPDKMEPFLDYFGEMSSRELDRIEAQEGKPKPKKSVIGGRKKRNMAIRFPGQSSATPSESLRKEYRTYDVGIPVDQLPVADMDNSSSDGSEGTSAIPLDRNEFVRKFLKEKNPAYDDVIGPDVLLGGGFELPKDDDSDTPDNGSGFGDLASAT